MKFKWLLVSVTILVAGLMYGSQSEKKSDAEEITRIDAESITAQSVIENTGTATNAYVFSDTEYLYQSSSTGLGAVVDFIEKNIVMVPQSNVLGVTETQQRDGIFPERFLQNVSLQKVIQEDGYFHYVFTQRRDGIPIFASSVAIHGRNSNEIYGVTGTIVGDTPVPPPKPALTDVAVEGMVRTYVNDRLMVSQEATITAGELWWYNSFLVGNSTSSETMVLVREYLVGTPGIYPVSLYRVLVDIATGAVVYDEPLGQFAVNREVYDCENSSSSTCPLRRRENSPPSGVRDVDGMYDALGKTYTFFSSAFQRDGYDDRGSVLTAAVNYPTLPDQDNFICPNAAWFTFPNRFFVFCPGMVVDDIVAHEYMHAVSEIEFNPITTGQTGSLGEAISDIFAYGVDRDWTMGEGSIPGIIRNMQNPPLLGQPDRMFSSLYSCAAGGSPHRNAGVVSKAFNLMVEGGSFNGCTLTGIGDDAALRIWYRAVTTYFVSTINYRGVYVAVTQACADLYGSASPQCRTTTAAFQAVEIDQQSATDNQGPACSSQQARPAACAAEVSPSPSLTPTRSPTPTRAAPTFPPSCFTKAEGDADCDGDTDLIDYEIWRKEFLGTFSTTYANFNPTMDTVVNVIDFEIWRRGFTRLL